jgi:hypothetical protein
LENAKLRTFFQLAKYFLLCVKKVTVLRGEAAQKSGFPGADRGCDDEKFATFVQAQLAL